METGIARSPSNCASVLQFRQPLSTKEIGYSRKCNRLYSAGHRFSATFICAVSAVTFHTNSQTQANETTDVDPFSCPICYEPLIRKGPPGFNLGAIYRSGFKCGRCSRAYSSKDKYLDLTVASGTKLFTEVQHGGTELFRSPVVSFLYERGWRQNFTQRGFPGPDEEFKIAQEYFKGVHGGVLVDLSCGSGLFTRKFAKSDTYMKVVALDFSENMLRQCYDLISEDSELSCRNLALVRGDVGRLPFSTGSVDAIHAGAALHCWPSPSNAMAEICRVLRSGGVFVGSTFLRRGIFGFRVTARTFQYFVEEEIKELCTSAGLINYTQKVDQSFVIFSVQKP